MIARARCPSRPLLLLSAKRRSALRDALVACAESWRSQWSNAREPLDVTVPFESEHAAARASLSIRLDFASRTHGDLGVLHADGDILPSLLALGVAADSAGAAHGLGRDLLVEMLRSLCREIAKRAQVDDVHIDAARVSVSSRACAGHLAAAFRVGHGKARVVALLTPGAVELLAPPHAAPHASAPLARRRMAVATESVRMEAVLGSAEVSLRDLVDLAVGDVIVLDQPLGRGGHLALPYGRVVAQVVVGRAGERRAVSIATQSEQRSERP